MLPVSIYLTPDGVEMIEGPGVTISDLRNQYPGCELIEVNHPAMSHNTDSFTLVPGVLYQITLPLTEGTVNLLELPEYSVVGGPKLYDDHTNNNKIKIKACIRRRKADAMKA